MKCPSCSAEVGEKDKFCGECGKPLRSEVASKWKWGSMIANLVLLFIFWGFA
jgi:predicted amidophosphoribosyltransferase